MIDAVRQRVALRPAALQLRKELLARMAQRRAKVVPRPPPAPPEVKAAPLSNQN